MVRGKNSTSRLPNRFFIEAFLKSKRSGSINSFCSSFIKSLQLFFKYKINSKASQINILLLNYYYSYMWFNDPQVKSVTSQPLQAKTSKYKNLKNSTAMFLCIGMFSCKDEIFNPVFIRECTG